MLNLKNLREKLDKIDKKLLKVLAERFEISHKVGIYKKEKNLPVLDRKREEQIFRQRKLQAQELNLDPILIEKIFKMIIKKVKENHKKMKHEK
jgi:monofunctional chorismate mutase